MMALLHHFRCQTCSIYWLVMICLGIVPDNKYQRFFHNALPGNSWIVINFVHFCMITICQSKNSQTRKNNLEKYISPFPQLIIINIPNWFVNFVIGRNNYGFWRGYSRLKKFCICKSLCIPIKYLAILVSFPLKDQFYCEKLDFF